MNLLSDLKSLISSLGIPVETGVFSEKAPDEYTVLIPLSDEFFAYADDQPGADVQSVRISLYTKRNYKNLKRNILHALLNAGYSITERQYMGFEYDTKYHHYNIDVENVYEMEEL